MNYVLCWICLTVGAVFVSDSAFGSVSTAEVISASYHYAVALVALVAGKYVEDCYVAWKARQ